MFSNTCLMLITLWLGDLLLFLPTKIQPTSIDNLLSCFICSLHSLEGDDQGRLSTGHQRTEILCICLKTPWEATHFPLGTQTQSCIFSNMPLFHGSSNYGSLCLATPPPFPQLYPGTGCTHIFFLMNINVITLNIPGSILMRIRIS